MYCYDSWDKYYSKKRLYPRGIVFFFKSIIPPYSIGGGNMATEESTLQISGMTCTACANRVEKGITKLPGVDHANVNFALEQLTVQYDPNETNVADFKKEIEKTGYGVVEQKAEFDISGMTCAACATKVEKGISKMSGVSNASVNFALETIVVDYNEKEVQPNDMMAKVKKLGYELKPKTDGQEKIDHKQAEIRKQTNKLIFSSILTLPLLWTMVAHFKFLSFIYLPDFLMNP